jgi:hypothetical protein
MTGNENDDLESATPHVVYTLDGDVKPQHFLAVVEGGFNDIQDEITRWWKAFESGEKAKPDEYNGIGHAPVADFDRWEDGDNA